MIAAIYFSPTDTSRKGAEAIAKALGDGEFLSIDVTRFDAEPERTEFGPEDAVVFGAPVYGGRLYRGCRERFRRFCGDGTPCIVTVTYGNRDYDDALLELFDLAREQGFVPAAAAALVGQHTYGSIQVGRPDASDLAQDREFAEKAAAGVRAKKALETVPGSRPYVKGDEGGRGGNFRPLTSDACTGCGLCVRECPEGAIGADCRTVDPDRCIACFRCIRRCPVGAKNMDVPAYREFAENFTQKLSARRENEYFL